jgi:UDP-glucose 4-epimerase
MVMNGKHTILVTGGAGYIGSHAVLALLDSGHRPVVIDNLVTGFGWAVPNEVTFYEGDVADSELVSEIITAEGIKAVMHFAGSVVVPESVENPLKYYHNNTARTRALIETMITNGVRHMIFSSTAATYGIPESSPVNENMPTQPINPYGTSKLMTEMMLRDVAAAHDFNYCALRYFNVAGVDVSVFGTDYATDDGTGVRDYIHVSDLAAAHVVALEALVADPASSHTLNCGYGHGYSVMQVLDAVDRVTNRKLDRRLEGRRAGDPDELISDNRAIKARFGWEPKYDDLDTIVRHALAWERKLSERQDI